MAKIKDPLDFKWRDKKGGIVGVRLFSQDGARAATAPVQRWRVVKQKFGVNNLEIVKAWRQLDSSEQAAWDTFGEEFPGVDKYGDYIRWTGFNWFTRLNSRLLLSERARIDAPPPDDVPTYTPSFNVWFHEPTGAFFLAFDVGPTGDEYFIVQRKLHRPISSDSPPRPLLFHHIYKFPTLSPIMVAYIPGPYPVPERHWCRAQAGDAWGLVDDEYFGDVQTGV